MFTMKKALYISWHSEIILSIADIFKDYSVENLQMVPDESAMHHRPPLNPCGEGYENLVDIDVFDYINSFNLNYLYKSLIIHKMNI